MSDPATGPRPRALTDTFRPGGVRRVKVTGFDGADILVRLPDGEGEGETGRIPGHEASMRRTAHPSGLFEAGQELDAEETDRLHGGQLHLSPKACETPALRFFLLGFAPGQVVAGTVAAVHDIGLLVQVDGDPGGLCTGFVRVPDLAHGWDGHPSEAVEAGRRITAEAVVADTRSGRVTLSPKGAGKARC